MVSFELFARPALRKMMGHPSYDRPHRRRLSPTTVCRRRPDGKTHYMRVFGAFGDDGRYHVGSVGAQGSHQLAATSLADAIADRPRRRRRRAGRDSVMLTGAPWLVG